MAQSIIFSTTNEIVSRLIRFITGSTVSHCAVSFDINGVQMVAHATIGGVVLISRQQFNAANTVVEEYQFVDDMSTEITNALKTTGVRYDYTGLIGFGYAFLLRKWLGIKAMNPLASPTAMVCSEFVMSLNKHMEIESWSALDPETMTAEDLLQICKRDKDNFIKLV